MSKMIPLVVPARVNKRANTRSASVRDDLRGKLRSLETIITDRDRKALNQPITSAPEFVLRLGQIERAYRDTKFDTHLRNATNHLYIYLKGAEKQDTSEYWKAR